ncbi:MAG: hypothetical protein LBL71_02595 [Endomicrobium sp.]|jgi:hypothetical protein|nr:hypothetical protein [Endomicrobium sp.]
MIVMIMCGSILISILLKLLFLDISYNTNNIRAVVEYNEIPKAARYARLDTAIKYLS